MRPGRSPAVIARALGPRRSILAVVLACGVLTYGGVSLFVVAFAVYPFAAALFREADIPKRLIPGAIALGAFTLTMDALPGSPQIQNLIPTRYFGTDAYAAPGPASLGGAAVLAGGLLWLERRRARAAAAGEGYGTGHLNEPEPGAAGPRPHLAAAVLPLAARAGRELRPEPDRVVGRGLVSRGAAEARLPLGRRLRPRPRRGP